MSEKKVYHPPNINEGPFGGAMILFALIFLALPPTQLLSEPNKLTAHEIVVEPSITAEERELFEDLAPLIRSDINAAIDTLTRIFRKKSIVDMLNC